MPPVRTIRAGIHMLQPAESLWWRDRFRRPKAVLRVA